MKQYNQFYVDGGLVASNGASHIPVVSPMTEQIIGEVRSCSPEDVQRAIASAQKTLPAWASSSLADRKALLVRLRAEIEKRTEAFAESLAREMGCPVWLGSAMQVPMGLRGLDFAIEGIDAITWTERVGNGLVQRVPVGVVAAITPWNFPLHQIVAKVAAAIAAGCTTVLKPSEVSPGTGQLFIEAIHASGAPAGLVNLVWGGADVGHALVTSPSINKISFTGSTNVGRQIMAAAAGNLTPVTLELGGKSAAVILDDADLDLAIPAVARLALVNAGQACVSQSRLIAPSRLVPEIVDRVRAALKAWPMGDPMSAETRLGPVATVSQFGHINRMIEQARADGARLCTGGDGATSKQSQGWFVPPTLFSDVTPDMDIAQKEVFGPVLALMGYDSVTDAIRLANSTRYGLSGAVWSADVAQAAAFASQMTTGQVVINGAPQNLATPFGGFGDSGFGRENGRFGIEELLTYRAVHGAEALS